MSSRALRFTCQSKRLLPQVSRIEMFVRHDAELDAFGYSSAPPRTIRKPPSHFFKRLTER
jgi:hypothetical protein